MVKNLTGKLNSVEQLKGELNASYLNYPTLVNCAVEAKESANIATEKASEAENSASSAKNSEKNSANSASEANNSASISNTAKVNAEASANASANSAIEAENSKTVALNAVGKTSYIGINGNWYEWDSNTNTFVDTGKYSKGDKGDKGDRGVRGYTGTSGVRFLVGTSTSGWTSEDCDYLCDGVDDQVEINNAIQALPTEGGEIIILDGTYNITAQIVVDKNNTVVRGNGNSTILKRMNSEEDIIIGLANTNYCCISSIYIDGNKISYPSECSGIYLEKSNNNILTDLTICSVYIGIAIVQSEDNFITKNTCTSVEENCVLAMESNKNVFCYNTLNLCSCCSLYLMESNDCNVTKNICSGRQVGMAFDDCNDCNVTENICSGCQMGIGLDECNKNIINGNNITNDSDNETASIGIMGCFDSIISGNNCSHNSTGIFIFNSNRNIIAVNNIIKGTGQPSDYTSTQFTIILNDDKNNTNFISSNMCLGKAVVIEGGTGNTEVNNKYE